MKTRILYSIACLLFPATISAQGFNVIQEKNITQLLSPKRNVWDENGKTIVLYNLRDVWMREDKDFPGKYHIIIDGFGQTDQNGLPALPIREDRFIIPINSTISIKILESEYTELPNTEIIPSRHPIPDIESTISIDSIIPYKGFYPKEIVSISTQRAYRGQGVLAVRFNPVQYNYQSKTVRIYQKIKYEIISNKTKNNETLYPSIFLQNTIVNNTDKVTDKNIKKQGNPIAKILIITTNSLKQPAEELAHWKRLLGYKTEIIAKENWNSTAIKNTINESYAKDNSLLFLILLGDHDDLPGISKSGPAGSYISDYDYGCLDGDNLADIYRGRIAVSSKDEAETVVNKIIQYEKNPTSTPDFYNHGLACAYFQDEDKDSHADRRFAQTAEEIRTYLNRYQNKNISRAYAARADVYPRYWNNGRYSIGEPIPADLRKDVAPFFPWDASAVDIQNALNQGIFLLLHRDHGSPNQWGDPNFHKDDLKDCANGNKLPVVFSMNCQTGQFSEDECLAEAFLRKENGGGVAVFAAGGISYSGYNDALLTGMIDAIWPNPGLRPQFGFSVDYDNLSPTPIPTYQLGQILDQGLLRMEEIYGSYNSYTQYTIDLYLCFGDPSMRICTTAPQEIAGINIQKDNQLWTVSSATPGVTISFVNPNTGIPYVAENVSTASYRIPNDISEFQICVSKHNYIPKIFSVKTDEDYIQNEVVSTPRQYDANVLKIGSNVTETKPNGPVVIENNVSSTGTSIEIHGGTTIEEGTIQIIKQ